MEKDIQNRLNNYASVVDAERLWGNIDAQLRPSQKPRLAWWVWAIGALLLASLAAFFFLRNDHPNEPQALVLPLETAKESSTDGMSALMPSVPNQASINSKKSVILNEAKELDKNEATALPTTYGIVLMPSEPNQASVNSKKSVILNEAKELDKNEAAALPATDGMSALMPSVNAQIPENQPFKTSNLFILEKLPTHGVNALSVMLNDAFPTGFDKSPEIGCYSFGKKASWSPYLGLYGGGQYPLKTLKPASRDVESLANLREDTETVLEGVVGGALLGLMHPSGFHIEAGAEYNRINERFEYTVTEIDTIGQTLTMGFIVNAPGDTTFFQDSVFVIEQRESLKKIYNKYSFIQIPITLGYEFRHEARFSPYIKGGIMINVSFEQKAEIMTSPSTSVLYESDNPPADHPFRSRIGITPHISLGARYEVNSWLHVFGEARYVHHLKDITHGDYPIAQRYKLPGINLGVRLFKPISYD